MRFHILKQFWLVLITNETVISKKFFERWYILCVCPNKCNIQCFVMGVADSDKQFLEGVGQWVSCCTGKRSHCRALQNHNMSKKFFSVFFGHPTPASGCIVWTFSFQIRISRPYVPTTRLLFFISMH